MRLLSPRHFTTSARALTKAPLDIAALLAHPTWSVASLLPPATPSPDAPVVPAKQLHHLLRLSALPPPASPAQEATMLATLTSQLHFLRHIQAVDTSGVEPLRSLRDETVEGQVEQELGMEELQGALDGEDIKGKWHRRVRRRREKDGRTQQDRDWDVLGNAERKAGRYFVVDAGKPGDS